MISGSTSNAFPGFEAIYQFTDPFASSAFRGEITPELEFAERLVRGEWSPPSPLHVTRSSGKELMDVIWTTSIHPIVINTRVVDVLEAERLTGWATYPVEVRSNEEESENSYVGLAITGRCGPIDDDRSAIVMREYPGGIFPVRRGLYFDPASWDGSDLFVSTGPYAFKFATAHLRNAFLGTKVSNIKFISASDVERPTED
jgi:hypothetical protein